MGPIMLLRCRDTIIRFPRRPLVMGIVNINDDSFCGDGSLDAAAALQTAVTMAHQGADIIDAGAESARTNRKPVTSEEEVARLLPFVREFLAWRRRVAHTPPPWDAGQAWPPLLSINTWRPEVAAAILAEGGDLLNDIGALPTDDNARICAASGAALLVMHSVGQPKVAHTHVAYPDIMGTLERFFEEKMTLARSAGLAEDHIILDPGIDFAKQREDNLRILADLPRLLRLGRPILLPISRKTVIGQELGLKNPNDRDAGTIACLTTGLLRGAHIFRVHNVPAVSLTIKTLAALT